MEDAEIFRAIRMEAIRDVPEAFAESVSEEKSKRLEDIADYLATHGRGDFVLGAFDGPENLIGIVGFYRQPCGKLRHKGTIWGMYVKPPYRRRGVARALLGEALERIRKLPGIREVQLSVSDDNAAAKALYESFGFRTCGVEIRALRVGGRYIDEQLMQLLLERRTCQSRFKSLF